MKVYYLKDNKKNICGIQIITDVEEKIELTTNNKLDGLWKNGIQIIGTCDFTLNCSIATARKRLIDVANFYNRESVNNSENAYINDDNEICHYGKFDNKKVEVTISRKQLFDK